MADFCHFIGFMFGNLCTKSTISPRHIAMKPRSRINNAHGKNSSKIRWNVCG